MPLDRSRSLRDRSQRRRTDDRLTPEDRFIEAELARIAGQSPPILQVKDRIRILAPTDLPILLLGSTGTGKSLAADVIHAVSRRSGELVAVNSSSITASLRASELFGNRRGAFTGATSGRVGLIESARDGTLFLDEVADLDKAVQATLLTVIEDGRYRILGDSKVRQVEFRLIAATNRSLEELADTSRFRRDLLARLRFTTIHLPDLADRGSDILQIAEELLPGICARVLRHREDQGLLALSPAAKRRLLEGDWPDNVRELAAVLTHAVLLSKGEQISEGAVEEAFTSYHGPPTSQTGHGFLQLDDFMAAKRRQHIDRALLLTDGHLGRAAELLGISVRQLYRYRKELGIE